MWGEYVKSFEIESLPGTEVVDSSKLTEYYKCPRKFFYKYILGFVRKGGFNFHLAFGTSLHKAMETLWEDEFPRIMVPNSLSSIEDIYSFIEEDKILNSTFDIFKSTYRKLGYNDNANTKQKTPEKFALVLVAFVKYMQLHRHEYNTMKDNKNVLLNEQKGTTFLFNTYPVSFMLDKIVNHSGCIKGIDYKTTGFGGNCANEHARSIQFAIYSYVLDLFFGEEANGIQTMYFILKNTKTDYIRDKKYGIFRHVDFETATYNMSKEYKLNILKGVLSKLIQLENDFEIYSTESKEQEKDYYMVSFVPNYTNCFSFRRPCTYLNLCTGCSNPTNFLTSGDYTLLYDRAMWNPLVEEEIIQRSETVNLTDEDLWDAIDSITG